MQDYFSFFNTYFLPSCQHAGRRLPAKTCLFFSSFVVALECFQEAAVCRSNARLSSVLQHAVITDLSFFQAAIFDIHVKSDGRGGSVPASPPGGGSQLQLGLNSDHPWR